MSESNQQGDICMSHYQCNKLSPTIFMVISHPCLINSAEQNRGMAEQKTDEIQKVVKTL